ncbi:glutamine synthetase family protein [candidate division KSB1 bacterium]
MSEYDIELSPNKIVRYLGIKPDEFTKYDLIRYIEENNIEMVNFRYVAGDRKLKTLNFIITSKTQLDRLLSAGERVDGSSLFSYVDAGSSDLYVIPRYKTAFVNPFSEIPAVDVLCSFYTMDGKPLPSSPENVLKKAHSVLKKETGYSLEAMGELEYYVLSEKHDIYPVKPQEGYHESAPFVKWEDFRCEAMKAIASTGGKIKYGHSEVGGFRNDEYDMEQHEIEFQPVPLEEAADQIVIAKWILRMLGKKYGVTVSFAPKISVGHAGSGLHIHSRLVKEGENVMIKNNELTDDAKRLISGYLELAPSLTAFGNTIPTSYLRLVPDQEAPTNICWGDRNRSALVRIPLSWNGLNNMIIDENPLEKEHFEENGDYQTVEFRASDGSADMHFLLAGMAVAARYALKLDNALELAEKYYIDVNIFNDENKKVQEKLPHLPSSCWESAECLKKHKALYLESGVFSEGLINGIIAKLKSYDDKKLRERLYNRQDEVKQLVDRLIHCS